MRPQPSRVSGGTYLDAYIKRVNEVKPLSRDEELALFERFRDGGDERAKEKLLNAQLRHVVAVAFKYRRYGLPLDELVAEGNLGVAYAISKYDPARGTRFVTYAVYWIRAHILNQVIRSFSLVGAGSGALRSKVFFKLRRERARLMNLVPDQEQTMARLAEKLGLPESKVVAMVGQLESRDVSLDAPVANDPANTLLDELAAPGASQESELAALETQARIKQAVDRALSGLDARERFIVQRRLMAQDEAELSLAEIGRHLGVSRERARQLENRLKSKLKTRIEELTLADGGFLDGVLAA